jgi:1-acyl-sn-glycerol-3-phosphate acyltransferase
LNAILSFWTWFEIGFGSFLGFFVQVALAVLTLPFDRRRRVVGRWFRLIAIITSKLTPFWRFGIHGAVPPGSPGRTVVVANHESQADPFLISYLPWEMKWLSKASMFKVPFLGWSMWLAGDIAVKRGTAESAREAMGKCAGWLAKGMPVMIFPEGTRSKTEELLPFKDGAFRLAIESGAAVLPIAVRGTHKALPKHSWRFGLAKALVTVGTPISTQGMTLADVERLKGLAREQIEALRATLTPLVAGP